MKQELVSVRLIMLQYKKRLVLKEWKHQPVYASQISQTRIPKAQYK
jgi:hypothetical protein